jgi:hypothetical protein
MLVLVNVAQNRFFTPKTKTMSILVENKHTIEDFTDCQNIKDFRDYLDI